MYTIFRDNKFSVSFFVIIPLTLSPPPVWLYICDHCRVRLILFPHHVFPNIKQETLWVETGDELDVLPDPVDPGGVENTEECWQCLADAAAEHFPRTDDPCKERVRGNSLCVVLT